TTLMDGRTERSASRYCPKVSHCKSTLAPIPPAHPRTASARPGAIRAGENEHMPTSSVVQPWRSVDSDDGQPRTKSYTSEGKPTKHSARTMPPASSCHN